jgi:hypothetical protein
MARTIDQIENEIIQKKDATPELAPMNSVSKTAVWRLFVSITAFMIHSMELMWDYVREDLLQIAARTVPGTRRWYHSQCVLYQYGDDISWVNGSPTYTSIDIDKQIIKRCSVVEDMSQLIIKVATENSGIVEKLTSAQLSSFQEYINQIKFAGTPASAISYDPDELNVDIKIFINPLIINNAGQLISDTSKKPVEEAIQKYIKELPFDGIFNINSLVDYIQKATGVNDIYINTIEAKASSATTFTTVDHAYTSVAGYFIVNQLLIDYV